MRTMLLPLKNSLIDLFCLQGLPILMLFIPLQICLDTLLVMRYILIILDVQMLLSKERWRHILSEIVSLDLFLGRIRRVTKLWLLPKKIWMEIGPLSMLSRDDWYGMVL